MSTVTMLNIKSGMCRWPIGNPEDEDFHFCGKPSVPTLPYCEAHREQAQAPARKAKTVK